MDRWAGKTAMVTGAASGIGKAITEALLKKKVNVLALDVDQEQLTAVAREWERIESRGNFCILRCDISKEEELEKAFSFVETKMNGVDVMINNAGVIEYTRVIDSNTKTFERLLNINVLAAAMCINRAVRSMRQRNVEGHIFNINSVLGHTVPNEFISEMDGYNGWNLYPTSKHGAVALTNTVRRELTAIKAPIRITGICPGVVRTNLAKHATAISEIINKLTALDPPDVADAVVYALGTRPEVEICEITLQCTGAENF